MKDRNYLPFDMAQAKAGMPVITRNGDSVVFITFGMRNPKYPISAIITQRETGIQAVGAFTQDGRVFDTGEESPGDLVMAPLEIDAEKWVLLYSGQDYEIKFGKHLFDTEEEARKAREDFYSGKEDGEVVKDYPICAIRVRVARKVEDGIDGVIRIDKTIE